jgi:hypothetical protein
VILMLLLTAALVITSTYMFLSREETDEFEKSVSLSMLGIPARNASWPHNRGYKQSQQ